MFGEKLSLCGEMFSLLGVQYYFRLTSVFPLNKGYKLSMYYTTLRKSLPKNTSLVIIEVVGALVATVRQATAIEVFTAPPQT